MVIVPRAIVRFNEKRGGGVWMWNGGAPRRVWVAGKLLGL